MTENSLDHNSIVKLLESVLIKMGVDFDKDIVVEQDELGVWFVVKSSDSGILIGGHGKTLLALNYLIRHLVGAREQFFIVDINNYHRDQINQLKGKVKVIAERVRSFETSIEMDPMTPFERRCVHSLFSNDPDILTESSGFGPDRRVILKYHQKQSPIESEV